MEGCSDDAGVRVLKRFGLEGNMVFMGSVGRSDVWKGESVLLARIGMLGLALFCAAGAADQGASPALGNSVKVQRGKNAVHVSTVAARLDYDLASGRCDLRWGARREIRG